MDTQGWFSLQCMENLTLIDIPSNDNYRFSQQQNQPCILLIQYTYITRFPKHSTRANTENSDRYPHHLFF